MEPERRVSAVDRRLLLAVLCALLAAVVSWTEPILVVPGWVLPHWAVAGTALLAAALLRIRPRSRPSGPWRAAFALPALAAVAGTALGGAGDLGSEYRVLDPAGPDGCRAVVRENAFLVIGDGTVYAVNGVGFAFPGSTWIADDGTRPIAAGQYELHWGERAGVLEVHGREGDPVMPSLHGVDCR